MSLVSNLGEEILLKLDTKTKFQKRKTEVL